MSALGQKRITANRMSALGQKQTCAAHMPFYFAPAATHSFTKRERSSIFTFCCSASFAHSRIFFALSLGIIFSGAVAFTSADATCARNIATKVIAVRNTVGRCLRMNALLWLVRDGSLSRKDARGGETISSAPWPLHTRRQTLVSDITMALRAISTLVQCTNLRSLFDHLVSERQKIYRQLDAR